MRARWTCAHGRCRATVVRLDGRLVAVGGCSGPCCADLLWAWVREQAQPEQAQPEQAQPEQAQPGSG